jgi:hypothetical protein
MAAMIHRKAQEVAQTLREKAKLEIVDPAIKAEMDKDNQLRPAAPAQKK